MVRSKWKLPYMSKIFFSNHFLNNSDPVIWHRNVAVSSSFVDKKCTVYNGIWFLSLNVTDEMIGQKFGEFCATKTINKIHITEKKKNVVNLKAKKAKAEKKAAKRAE